MKSVKTILTVVILAAFVATLTGCQAQDGGMKIKGPQITEDGLSLFSLETNGSQVAAGKDVNNANTRFNNTTLKKDVIHTARDLSKGKNSLVKSPEDFDKVIDSLLKF